MVNSDKVADGFHGVDYAMSVLGHHLTQLRQAWAIERESKGQPYDPTPTIAKLRLDLAWRGPNGKKAGHICLPYESAEKLLEWIDEQQRRIRERESGTQSGA